MAFLRDHEPSTRQETSPAKDEFGNIGDWFAACEERFSNRIAFQSRNGLGRTRIGYREACTSALQIAAKLSSLQVGKGDRVMILCENGPGFALTLLACARLGAVVVPVDLASSPQLIGRIADRTRPRLGIHSSALEAKMPPANLISVGELTRLDSSDPTLNSFPEVTRSDLFEIVYTSGTTGSPKGVMITHGNVLANLRSAAVMIPELPRYESVSILPLSHMLEQIINLFLPLSKGACIRYPPRSTASSIAREFRYSKCTHLVAVPLVLKRMLQSVEAEAARRGRAPLYELLLKLSRPLPFALRRQLFRSIHRDLGRDLRFFAVGGATLDREVSRRWERLGIQVLEGYGATEVTAVATGPWVGRSRRPGSCGRPLPGNRIRLSGESEILVSGPNVSPGYFEDEVATDKAFREGWYHTGDVGRIERGHLRFVGRKHFKIVLTSGENVYTEDLERCVNDHPAVIDSCAVASQRSRMEVVHVCLILKRRSPRVSQVVDEINCRLEDRQQIREYSLWPGEDFPRTRTLKIDRDAVADWVRASKTTSSAGSAPPSRSAVGIETTEALLASVTGVDQSEITSDTKLIADLALDSMARIELISKIEEEFGASLTMSELEAVTTVRELNQLVNSGQASSSIPPPSRLYGRNSGFRRELLQSGILLPIHRMFVRLDMEGIQNRQGLDPPFLLIWNHVGPLDAVCGLRALPHRLRTRVAFGADSDFWDPGNRPFVRKLLEAFANVFPLGGSRGQSAREGLETAAFLLDSGWIVATAPEGRLQREGKLQDFKPGVAHLAVKLGVPVLPVWISPDYGQIFPTPAQELQDSRLAQMLPSQRGRVAVRILEPLSFGATTLVEEANRVIRAQFEDPIPISSSDSNLPAPPAIDPGTSCTRS